MSSIKVGDTLPSFSLPNQEGQLVAIDSLRAGKNLVLFFYPKDETLICTKEACGFRNDFDEFKKYNCVVVGISADSPQSHKSFKEHHNLPYTLLSDDQNKVRKLLGLGNDFLGLLPGRYTLVINKEGIIKLIFNAHFTATNHISKSLETLQQNEQRSN